MLIKRIAGCAGAFDASARRLREMRPNYFSVADAGDCHFQVHWLDDEGMQDCPTTVRGTGRHGQQLYRPSEKARSRYAAASGYLESWIIGRAWLVRANGHPTNCPKEKPERQVSGFFRSKLLFLFGERDGTRTHDPLIKSQMLYQLSYALPFGVSRKYKSSPLWSIGQTRLLGDDVGGYGIICGGVAAAQGFDQGPEAGIGFDCIFGGEGGGEHEFG